jgi:hypothetical protein
LPFSKALGVQESLVLALMNKIHRDTKLTAVVYGTFSSLVAAIIIEFSPPIFLFLSEHSFDFFKNYVDSKYAKSASLEATNYSFYISFVIFIISCVIFIEVFGRVTSILKDDEKKEDITNNEESPKWVSKTLLFAKLMAIFYLISALMFIVGETIVLNNIGDFKQHIRIITPYISEAQKNELISEWSQMRNVEDYNKLYEELLSISKKNEITLYKNQRY